MPALQRLDYHSICIEECKAVLFDPVQRRVFRQHGTQTCLAVVLKATDKPETTHMWFSYFYGKNLFHAGITIRIPNLLGGCNIARFNRNNNNNNNNNKREPTASGWPKNLDQMVTLLACVREVPGTILVPKASYSDLHFMWFSSAPAGKLRIP
jgi:hypothetical protein